MYRISDLPKKYLKKIQNENIDDLHSYQKLTIREAAEIKWFRQNTNLTIRYLAGLYPVSHRQIGRIGRDESWEWVEPRPPDIGIRTR